MSHRFFVSPACVSEGQVVFTEDQRKQIKNVLRLHPGEIVYTLDNSGREYVTEIQALDESRALGRIMEVRLPATESKMRMTLIQAMPKGEKLDFILQKCTEIGVSKFVLTETERSVARIPTEKVQARLDRWRAIVREAAEQSGRACLPVVEGILPFRRALEEAAGCPAMMAWEGERTANLIAVLRQLGRPDEVAVLIGPEGGFTAGEVDQARAAGIVPVSLGPRTLRTETAAIVASALVILGQETGMS